MTDNPTSLYTAWFNAVPQAFRAMLPAGAAGVQPLAAVESGQAPLSFPVDQVDKALKVLDGVLTQLYQSYMPLLAQGNLAEGPVKALASAGTEMLNRMLEATANAGAALPGLQSLSGFAQLAGPWSALLPALVPGAQQESHPGAELLQTGMERAFGGLGDAFGLRPMRELEEACREAIQASVSKRHAQLEYLAVVAQAWSAGTQRLLQDLNAMGARGERVESLLVLVRLWAKAIDAPMHDAMQGEGGLAVTAKLIRASSEHRQHLQKAIKLASEALQIPTRADVDEAYREIQELKRELRRLKRSMQAAVPKKRIQAKEHKA